MKLDKEDIATANEMAKTLQQSKNSELIVVGNLLAFLLKEREALAQPHRTWVGLTDEDWDYLNKYCGSIRSAIQTAETLLKEKNTK